MEASLQHEAKAPAAGVSELNLTGLSLDWVSAGSRIVFAPSVGGHQDKGEAFCLA